MRELQRGERERERGKKRWALMSVTCSCHMLKYFNTINQTRDKRYRHLSLPSYTYTVCDHSIKTSWIYLKIHPSVKQKNMSFSLQTAKQLPLSYIEAGCILEASATPRSWPLVWTSGTRGCCRSGCSRPGRQTLTFYVCQSKTGRKEHTAYLDSIWTLCCVSNDGITFV